MAEKVFMFPDAGYGRGNGIDPGLLALMNNNGGFGNGNAMWLMFLWFLYPMMMNGGFGGCGNNFGGANGFLANQANNIAGRDFLAEIMNGRFDALGQLAQLMNTSIENVKSAVNSVQLGIQNVSGQIGMSALQIQNAIQSGDAALSRQFCECCCENRLAIANQTATLQSQLASNDANVRLQLAQLDGSDKLAICQQTNTLQNQAERDTNAILNAISGQNTLITKEFCDLKERELQNKINTQGDIITQLRNQISNDHQTLQFNAAFHALDDKIDAIAAKQPNTVPVTWPNLTAVNNTPNINSGYPYVYGYGYGNGFGPGIVF